jgi:hypothetical protein
MSAFLVEGFHLGEFLQVSGYKLKDKTSFGFEKEKVWGERQVEPLIYTNTHLWGDGGV